MTTTYPHRMNELFHDALHSGGVWVVIIAWIVIGLGALAKRGRATDAAED